VERWRNERSQSDNTECQVFVSLSVSFSVKPWESESNSEKINCIWQCACRFVFVAGMNRRAVQTCRVLWSNKTIC
jgi:hypothetical protein